MADKADNKVKEKLKKTTDKIKLNDDEKVQAVALGENQNPKNEEVEKDSDAKAAKAGRRSAKAIRESEEKEAKETRKKEDIKAAEKPKQTANPPRSRAERAGKKYREAFKQIEEAKIYSFEEAVALAVKSSTAKFDSTVELHVNLGVDPKQADQNVRSTVTLPAGTGKELRVAAFVEETDVQAAKKSGADIAGADKLEEVLSKEQIDFDVLIATPALMARLSKFARFLGPRGLMPNPKSGTVTNNISKAITEAKAGRVEYRVDANGIIHMGVGKVSFGEEKLKDNASAALKSIREAKPASLKGTYVKGLHITTTMGPSIKSELPK